MTDLVVTLFVAILVVAGLKVPAWGDALGRLLRRGAPAGGSAERPPGGAPREG
jgi:hypothetical protein